MIDLYESSSYLKCKFSAGLRYYFYMRIAIDTESISIKKRYSLTAITLLISDNNFLSNNHQLLHLYLRTILFQFQQIHTCG